MRKYDDKELVEFIFEFIDDISHHLKFGGGEDSFLKEKTIREACTRELHKIAETTQKLSAGLKNELNEIDWKKVSGMRNILVHEYLEGFIDPEIVFKSIKEEIPKLQKDLKEYYNSKFSN